MKKTLMLIGILSILTTNAQAGWTTGYYDAGGCKCPHGYYCYCY